MFNYKYILVFSCAILLLLSCAPSSYHIKRHNAFRGKEQSRNLNQYNKFKDQDFSFYGNNKIDYYYDFNHDNRSGWKKKKYHRNNDIYKGEFNSAFSSYNRSNAATDKNKTYIVRKGDNLFKISRKFNTAPDEIAHLNKIKNRNKIYTGMKLKIPGPKKYLYSINKPNEQNRKSNPNFIWPIKKIYSTKRDGLEGVKSIGIIITGKPNTSVLSSADGIVTKVGHMRGFGNYIILKHKNKYLTTYSNLKYIKVNEGDIIKKGEKIGSLNGSRLHFQIGYAGKPEDPFIYLSRKS